MLSALRPATVVLLVAVMSVGPACRKVSQPALDESAGPEVLLPVEVNGQWGYISRAGSLAIPPQFDRAYHFVENRALVREEGRYGFIDSSGTPVIPPTYAAAGPFSEGLAPVRPDRLWGFIDRSGSMVIDPQFALAGPLPARSPRPTAPPRDPSASRPDVPTLVPAAPRQPSYFAEGRARIRTDDGWGYVDRRGSRVVPPTFARAWDFQDGRARVRFDDGTMGYIAPNGRIIWPPARSSPSRTRRDQTRPVAD